MLMSIPVISPIEVTLRDAGVRRLPAPESDYPDYEVHALSAPAATAATAMASGSARTPAHAALDEIEHATQVSEYHDFSWWDERLRIIRAALDRVEGQA